MPIIKSAKKRVRNSKIRFAQNKNISLNLKKHIKAVLLAIEKKDKKKSVESLKIGQKIIMKAVNRGILKKKNASRKISSLNKKIKVL